MKNLLILSLATFLLGISCKEDVPNAAFKEGIIMDGRPQAADGCGWLIRVDSVTYHPVNLRDDLKSHGQKVRLMFEILGEKFECGFRYNTSYQKMKILQIRSAL